MAHTNMAARLRELHLQRPFLLPNAWTIGSALRLERLGFAAVGTTSAGLALDAGVADGEAGRARTLAVAGAIAGALAIPVSADLENGFDDRAEGCAATVLDAMARGVAGGSIEDATGKADDPIYPLDHAVDRIRAVAQAIRASGGDFVLTARSENFLHGRPDLQDTIARLKAFEEAGADVLFAPGLPDLTAIRAVRAAVSRPLNVLLGSDGIGLTAAALAGAGAARISLGSALARAADRAAMDLAGSVQADLYDHWSKAMSHGSSARPSSAL